MLILRDGNVACPCRLEIPTHYQTTGRALPDGDVRRPGLLHGVNVAPGAGKTHCPTKGTGRGDQAQRTLTSSGVLI